MLELKRRGGTAEEPYCSEFQNSWPDATALSVHLGRLPGLTFVVKKSWVLTDDVELYFEYRGYRFVLESPFALLWLTALSPEVPGPVFQKLEEHLKNYRAVWPHRYLAAPLKNLLLPFRPPLEWRHRSSTGS